MKFVCFSGGARRGETEDRAGVFARAVDVLPVVPLKTKGFARC